MHGQDPGPGAQQLRLLQARTVAHSLRLQTMWPQLQSSLLRMHQFLLTIYYCDYFIAAAAFQNEGQRERRLRNNATYRTLL